MLAGSAAILLGPASPAAAGFVGELSYPSPGVSTWTVPAGVNGAVFTVDGAAGGAETTFQGVTTPGGNGGEVTGFLPVTPGEAVTLYVGGAGQNVQGFYNTYAAGGNGGYNGGGNGGGGDDPGAGGGGASWVVVGGAAQFIGAGGGGGSGSWLVQQQSPGGNGGGWYGADGSINDSQAQYGPARGGSPSSGGSAGWSDLNTGETSGGYGTGGYGGAADPNQSASFGGAGGGGGWYGGGGGGQSGGAGGSSYASSSVLDDATTAGVQTGNGAITIEYGSVEGASIDQNPLPDATAGAPYTHTFTATGWPAPSFVAIGGSLPAGLQLSSTGVLSGTLDQAGTYDFTIGADNAESFVSRAVQLVVDPGAPATLTAGVDSPTGGSGTVEAGGVADLVAAVSDAEGNPVPDVLVEFDLPAGGPWTFPGGVKTEYADTAANGQTTADVLTGANLGTFDATVSATGVSPVTDEVTVVPSQPGMDGGGTQPGGLVSKPYDDQLTVFGTPAPTVTVQAGALPPGLTLSGDDISGTPRHIGTYAFTLRVDNGAPSGPVDVPCTISISRTPQVSIAGGGVNPGSSGLFAVPLPVTLSAAAAVPVTVHWATRNGTATAPVDYVSAHGDLTIPVGASSGTVTVQVRGHRPGRGTLTFSVSLSAPVNARIPSTGRNASISIYYG